MVVQNVDPDEAAKLLLVGNAKSMNVCSPKVLYSNYLSGCRRADGCTLHTLNLLWRHS